MSALPQQNQITAAYLALLRCPVCHGALTIETGVSGSSIRCEQCDRGYPIVDGLPVLIPERSFSSSTYP